MPRIAPNAGAVDETSSIWSPVSTLEMSVESQKEECAVSQGKSSPADGNKKILAYLRDSRIHKAATLYLRSAREN